MGAAALCEGCRDEKEEFDEAISHGFSGKLIVKVVRATELHGGDVLGKGDPYVELCIVSLDSKKKKKKFLPYQGKVKTATKKKTKNPTWNEKFEFEVENWTTDYLMYKVYDWDRFTANDLIGKGHPLPLSKLPKDFPLLWKLPLGPKGTLFLQVTASGFGTPPPQYKLSVSQTKDMMGL